ncbi:MAG: acyl-CoA dehydrogenase [Candidatus Dadabacteria bacterium]|nr:MAG: acyl-CoA dehydrogenase [Candidatus Dadabacteria bacterium]
MNENPGRLALQRWKREKPDNFYHADPNLAATIRLLAGDSALARIEERLAAFGAEVATVVDRLADEYERIENLPALRRYSPIGERTEEIVFHPSYHEAGRRIWASGILACRAEPGTAIEQAALFYLLTHLGEGGHACPIACTTGLIRALQTHATEALRKRYLPPLINPDYDEADRASQFLTEVQGGSDVGANLVEAVRDGDVWRISGEKWFCSVADADQFLVTARVAGGPRGTAGLGTFLVPRRLDDGSLNRFSIRRLKIKLGTRAMASGEIDFDGAEAYPIGPVSDGFKIAVGVVLNTSRWLNAVGSAGIMQRCYLEARSFAEVREAFGRRIVEFPAVRETLATMKCEQMAAMASTFYLTHLIDRIDLEQADEHERKLFRWLVNTNKYITSIAASDVTRMAVEVLGGNGTIEDFSPVPRLLRDNVVFESWEGTHNVLVAQVLRDSAKLGLLSNVHDAIRTWTDHLEDPRLLGEARRLVEALSELSARMARSLAEPAYGAAHFRRQLTELARIFQAARLLAEADEEQRRQWKTRKAEVAEFFIRRHLTPGYRPEEDAEFAGRVDRILSA